MTFVDIGAREAQQAIDAKTRNTIALGLLSVACIFAGAALVTTVPWFIQNAFDVFCAWMLFVIGVCAMVAGALMIVATAKGRTIVPGCLGLIFAVVGGFVAVSSILYIGIAMSDYRYPVEEPAVIEEDSVDTLRSTYS